LGLLKAKLARYRAQLLEPTTKSGSAGTGFDVQKSGDARVALIGFPSVGKVGLTISVVGILPIPGQSTLLSKVTATQSETAAYEFTTLTVCHPLLFVMNTCNFSPSGNPRCNRIQRCQDPTSRPSRDCRRCKSRSWSWTAGGFQLVVCRSFRMLCSSYLFSCKDRRSNFDHAGCNQIR